MKDSLVIYYFMLGGPFMYPLLLLFAATLVIVIERIIYYVQYNWTVVEIFNWFISGNHAETGVDSRLSRNPLKEILESNLALFDGSIEKLDKWLESDFNKLLSRLKTNLFFLQVISVIAPVIGFLGTVWGMVRAFEKIAGASEVTPQQAAGGIYQALITTAFGLIITVIATFAFYLFNQMVNRYAGRLESYATDLYRQLDRG
jgi:biopolymer transport protein ExbB